jgi:hypothetical protein
MRVGVVARSRIGDGRRQTVELGRVEPTQRPRRDPLACARVEPYSDAADVASVVVHAEAQLVPELRRISHDQLVDRDGHAASIPHAVI